MKRRRSAAIAFALALQSVAVVLGVAVMRAFQFDQRNNKTRMQTEKITNCNRSIKLNLIGSHFDCLLNLLQLNES